MSWFFPTRTFVSVTGHDAEAIGQGTTGVDDAFAAAGWGFVGVNAQLFGSGGLPAEEEQWRWIAHEFAAHEDVAAAAGKLVSAGKAQMVAVTMGADGGAGHKEQQ